MLPPLTQTPGARSCTMSISLTSVFGTLQIMVGLFNIGLGPGRTSTHPEDLTDLGAAYWLGAVFVTSGIVSLVFCPSICWIGFTALMNIVAAILSIVGIALYVIDLEGASVTWMCNNRGADDDVDNCVNVAYFAQKLLSGMDITLVIMAVLQLIISIISAVLCILALCGGPIEENFRIKEDSYEPMVKKVMTGA